MKALVYRYVTSLKNQIRKALRKPVTYIYIIGVVGYFLMFVYGMKSILGIQVNRPDHMFFIGTSILTVFGLSTCLLSYAKRKGLIFTQSDVHFLFSSPVSPKKVLIYAHIRGLFGGVLVVLFLVACGIVVLKISLWKIGIYLLYNFVIETAFELALMISLYGNETISEKGIKLIQNFLRVIVGFVVLYTWYVFSQNGFSFATMEKVLGSTVIQAVPILGWAVAFFQLLFLGPSVVNIVCSILYGCFILFLCLYAYRMKCTGEYMEEAMKFADDYMEVKQKAAKGETAIIGKKQKFKQAAIEYKGNGAKALFYRQLLEYKKTKWFIFGWVTLIHLALGIGSVYVLRHDNDLHKNILFYLCGISAYAIMLLSGYITKWQKELASPYTFMIPDTSMKKLWYSSIIEHIRSLFNGILLILPGAIVGKAPVIGTILVILSFVCFSANKTYAGILSEGMLGGILGNTAVTMVRFCFVTATLLLSLAGAGLGYLLAGMNLAFLLFIFVTVLVTIILAVISSTMFEKMER